MLASASWLVGDQWICRRSLLGLRNGRTQISRTATPSVSTIPLDDWEPLSPEAEGRTISTIIENVRELQESGSPQISNIRFELDLNALFGANSQPGDVVPVQIVAQWNGGAQSSTASITHHITKLSPYMPPPYANLGSGSWVSGDLHVHNCP